MAYVISEECIACGACAEECPVSDPVDMKINDERAKYWLGVGAQPTDTVRALLKKGGVL